MKVNGNEYKLPNIDYNAVCLLSDYGVELFGEKSVAPPNMVRGFLALCLGSTQKAGIELQTHMSKHGFADMKAWSEEIADAIEAGDFLESARQAALAEKKKNEAKARREAAKAAKAEAAEAFGTELKED